MERRERVDYIVKESSASTITHKGVIVPTDVVRWVQKGMGRARSDSILSMLAIIYETADKALAETGDSQWQEVRDIIDRAFLRVKRIIK